MSLLFSNVGSDAWPKHLVYVEWFTRFSSPHPDHGLYKVSCSTKHDSRLDALVRLGEIVTVNDLKQSCHLILDFGPVALRDWTSNTVLDQSKWFYVNAYTDRNTYKLMI